MPSFFNQLFPESEDRAAILFRYSNQSLLDEWSSALNTGNHECRIIKKNDETVVFIISVCNNRLIIYARYDDDDDRYRFVVTSCKKIASNESLTFELDKINYLNKSLEFAIMPDNWKYRNKNTVDPTVDLFNEVKGLDNYDVKIAEIRRQEEIRQREEQDRINAEKQNKVWKQYILKEKELLEKANKPFIVANAAPQIHKTFVDVQINPQLTIKAESDILEDIANDIGGTAEGDKIKMNLTQFTSWQSSLNMRTDVSILGVITITLSVTCESFRNAKNFKSQYNYGPEFRYGDYDYDKNTIVLIFKSSDIKKILKFYENVNRSYDFSEEINSDEAIITFSVNVTITEPVDERKKRIEILDGRDLYSCSNMEGVYLGKLSKQGSDKITVRILLPREKKEEKSAAIDSFKRTGTEAITKIYPGLVKDITLLERELDAISKIEYRSYQLYNSNLKDFIYNSYRARPTQLFEGLESLQERDEYKDCHNSALLRMNPSQQEAVVKGLYAEDLCLLQGPPGTGKTTVISELIWQHIRKKRNIRIMLTSQTNLAIDNALNRIFSNSSINEDSYSWRYLMLIKPVRKADYDKIEDERKPFYKETIETWANDSNSNNDSNNIVQTWMQHIAKRVNPQGSYSEVLLEWQEALKEPNSQMRKVFAKQYLNDSNVLCMTCGKVDSSDFREYEAKRGFDVVIVDEASKATPPELLMPLCYAKKSIIIGDHRQLPPVIFEGDFFEKIREIDIELYNSLDGQFRHELVEESLFKRLITNPLLAKSIKATFNIQYRMHPDINDVISQFYIDDSNGLCCGLNPSKVDIPNFDERDSRYHGFSLGTFIQPNVHTIWVDVPDGMEQGGEGNSSFNEKEVEAVKLVIEALHRSKGFSNYMNYWHNCNNPESKTIESEIGVISFYAAQVQRIRSSIQSFCDRNNIRFSTKSVDRFQGKESGIVVVSTVRTKKVGFTKSPERLNVALSRARRLLIIVGNSKFFETVQTKDNKYIYKNVIDTIKSDGNNDVFIDYRDLKTLLGY